MRKAETDLYQLIARRAVEWRYLHWGSEKRLANTECVAVAMEAESLGLGAVTCQVPRVAVVQDTTCTL